MTQFVEFRKTTIRRKSKFNISKNNQRLEILKGYLIVFANLDKIIKIIRRKEDPKKIPKQDFGTLFLRALKKDPTQSDSRK